MVNELDRLESEKVRKLENKNYVGFLIEIMS
jgi:hypothetical protein